MVGERSEVSVYRARRNRALLPPGALLWGVIILIVLYVLAPIAIIVITAFSSDAFLHFPPSGWSLRWFEEFFNTSHFIDSSVLSIELAAIASCVAVVGGVMAALGLATESFRGSETIRTLIVAPFVVPSVVLGLALLIFFSNLGIGGSLLSLVIAHIVITFPYVVRIVSAGLQAYDRSVDVAAASLGASPWIVFRTVTMPLMKGSIIAAVIFAFITSFDEVTTTLFIIGTSTATLPTRVFTYVEYNSDPLIAAISTLQLVMTIVVVVIVERSIGFTKFLR